MHELSKDEKIREQCLARALYEGDMSSAWEKGEQRIIALTSALIKANRYDDLKHIEDRVFREQLFKEFEL